MIGNILDNTTELCMIKYAFGEIFSSGGVNLYKNPSDQTVATYNFHVDYSPIFRKNNPVLNMNYSLSVFHCPKPQYFPNEKK